METSFKVTRTSREIYTKWLESYTLEQLNKIPQGFNNNLIWNIGHIMVSQQILVYGGAGLPMNVSGELLVKYRRGSKPETDATQEEINEIKNLLFSTIEKTEDDYKNGVFTTYNARTSELGFELSSVEDAIAFNNYHEGIHLGIMMQLKKFI
ncbi:DinB family protein [Flavobacterium rakeshii]|uniref:DinB family protein n=1 Tax=Flavobacterium rakeshii TaxID=1038845 RepID=A0A6N8HIP4_9FLAO|nr:DinB family protein [Flavobacterium rakeshii]MEE1899057.1 DinB family protein [Flavobacterium rakeshii]MUV05528.1 DinB family protein [Flavobacterium rakeshii]